MQTYPINPAGIKLLHDREAFVGHAYPDPYSPLGKALRGAGLWRKYLAAPFAIPASISGLSGAPWTIGWGFTEGVREGDRMTLQEADARLAVELDKIATAVRAACTVPPNENQLAAMVVLAYNIGLGWSGSSKPKGAKDGFRQSSVLKAHNRGDTAAAARAFRLWNKAGGEVSPGLEARRLAESQLYLTPASGPAGAAASPAAPVDDVQTLMPQAVDAERPLTASTINRASVAAGGTAAVATIAETARTVTDIKSSAERLGDWLLPMLLVGIVLLCGYIVWERVKVRREGWS
ncbi:lysozyme [Paracidovorax wautersii]|uniref:Lysozyme n=1 Tax=Paracidovorax wautersii TaxID=1177982 RepID=A0A1I2GBY1_9BURK|nr:lysozyme [Paracidovorax wautersii]SFF14639.1 lysozyme [Paracidovorax wautersii]